MWRVRPKPTHRSTAYARVQHTRDAAQSRSNAAQGRVDACTHTQGWVVEEEASDARTLRYQSRGEESRRPTITVPSKPNLGRIYRR